MQKEVYLIYYGVVRSKKNSKRIIRNHRTGQMGLISSKEAKENEDDMVKQFKARAPRDIISSPVKIKIEMFEPNRTRRDLDNQATSILDALVKAGIIKEYSSTVFFEQTQDINEVFGCKQTKSESGYSH